MTEREILEAALEGLQIQLARVDGQISRVRSLLPREASTAVGPEECVPRHRGRPPKVTEPVAAGMAHRQRHLSPAGRKAISDAAKRRWQRVRQQRGTA